MPYSKNPKDYPDGAGFVTVIERTMEADYEMSFTLRREAQHFRARFNGYRNALKFQALAMPHMQAIADAGALITVSLQETKLVFRLLLPRNNATVIGLIRQLEQFMLGVPQELPTPVPVVESPAMQQDPLEKYGYVPGSTPIADLLNPAPKPAEPSEPLLPQPKQKEHKP